jgi:Rap1a immunity proteins
MGPLACRGLKAEGKDHVSRFWITASGGMSLVFCVSLLSGAAGAAPMDRARPIVMHARTAGELAALCSAEPGTPGADAKLNYCDGFAQGAVEVRLAIAHDKKPFCFPSPAPRRSVTMREFAEWVRAASDRGEMPVLNGLFRFLSLRFPCKP